MIIHLIKNSLIVMLSTYVMMTEYTYIHLVVVIRILCLGLNISLLYVDLN